MAADGRGLRLLSTEVFEEFVIVKNLAMVVSAFGSAEVVNKLGLKEIG